MFIEGGKDGTLSGTSWVDVVLVPPDSSTRRVVRNVNIYNADSAPVEIWLALDNAGAVRILARETMEVGETFIFDNLVVLDSTSKKLKAKLTSAIVTLNPDFVTAWGDAS